METNQDIASQSREILQMFVMWVAQTCPSPPYKHLLFLQLCKDISLVA